MLEPLHFGFVLAMLIVLSISRPFIFREWSMMVIGLVWGIAIAQAVSAFGPDWGVSIRETSETLSLQGYWNPLDFSAFRTPLAHRSSPFGEAASYCVKRRK